MSSAPPAKSRAVLLLALLVSLAFAAPLAIAQSNGDEPTVFTASSLTDVFPRIEPNARFNFAGSNQLAFQIEQGAPADVFAAANTVHPNKLYQEGLVEKPVIGAWANMKAAGESLGDMKDRAASMTSSA